MHEDLFNGTRLLFHALKEWAETLHFGVDITISMRAVLELLLREVEQGIQGSGIKPGIIKCATDHFGVTPFNEKLLRVTSRVHRASGLPISTHTSVTHHVGPRQQDVFADEGVDLSRVVIGHCGDTDDVEHLEKILARGSTIAGPAIIEESFTTIVVYPGWEARVDDAGDYVLRTVG